MPTLRQMKALAGVMLMMSAQLVGGHSCPDDNPTCANGALEFTWEIRLFALVMTLISSLATGIGSIPPPLLTMSDSLRIGGLIVALGGSKNERQASYLLNFSFGVMLYISFADILADTSQKIGWLQANLAVRDRT